jgi:branched-chain amino acid transport system permease protein
MDFFLQQLINAITLGGFYALIALGYTMVYGIIQLINFAHGEFFAAGGYLGVVLLAWMNAHGYMETHPWLCLALAFVLAMSYCALLAMGVEKIAYKPLRRASKLSVLLSALGMSIFLQNGLMLTQGVYDKSYPGVYAKDALTLGGFNFTYLQLIAVGTSALLMVGLNRLVYKTRLGKAMRATSQDRVMATLVGISPNRIISVTFAIGAALAGASGILVGLYYGSVRYDMGFVPGIKAFAAAVLGGIGSVTGAMLGGLIIGITEIFTAAYISSDYKDVFSFVILIAVLYFMPTGLLGENINDTRV